MTVTGEQIMTPCRAGESEREGPDHQSREGQTDSHPNINVPAAEACGEGVMAEGFQ